MLYFVNLYFNDLVDHTMHLYDSLADIRRFQKILGRVLHIRSRAIISISIDLEYYILKRLREKVVYGRRGTHQSGVRRWCGASWTLRKNYTTNTASEECIGVFPSVRYEDIMTNITWVHYDP